MSHICLISLQISRLSIITHITIMSHINPISLQISKLSIIPQIIIMSHINPISLHILKLSIIPHITIISYLKRSTSMKSEDTQRKLNVFGKQSITEWYATMHLPMVIVWIRRHCRWSVHCHTSIYRTNAAIPNVTLRTFEDFYCF